ncbi:uncharacterized protein N7496_001738 [Penicillium cataractarum]|uniref:F-box domain-containing protein n=1 Tax=Penicillium cataractarum TaxID=2100454 RepID=A0A9W9VWU1_9EURO|nr:uncharacterized protein N7496_001738 [Penicillium cataractarum]KAJ5390670.1 hypothetical protein N7496_001738 [Penicillium cataractarum]
MELINLPTELILIIANSVENHRELPALASTCRFLYEVANPILYAHNAKYEGSFALPWATKMGIMETVKLCIEHGANLNAHDGDRRTALIHAADNEDTELAELLLDIPTTYISACDIDGNSATFLAARNDDAEMLDLLLHRC